MFSEKKIDVLEDKYGLTISYKWFKPMAFFMLFFTLFWDGFLIFWYSMALFGGMGGVGIIFFLFPLIHVAVGVWLTYTTLCLFLNKTTIDVSGSNLSVRHHPIPWWKGNKNYSIEDIAQFYIKEKKTNNKNGERFNYELRAKLKSNEDVSIISGHEVESHVLENIEERLEKYLGINDSPVKGEYGKTNSLQKSSMNKPRQFQRTSTKSVFSSIYNSNEGQSVHVKNEELKIIHLTQYDWKNGDSDKWIQTINQFEEEKLLYIKQNKALLNAFVEDQIGLIDANEIFFLKQNPPKFIDFKGEKYLLSQYNEGQTFMINSSKNIDTQQWFYKTSDGEKYIRITNNDNLINYFEGVKLSPEDLDTFHEDTLDLDDLKEQEKLKEKQIRNNWDEEDLV